MDESANSDKVLRARIAANERWAQTSDRSAATAPARAAALKRFERLVDPNNELTEHERAVRAEAARRAHFLRMALKSAKARRKRRGAAPQPDLGGAA